MFPDNQQPTPPLQPKQPLSSTAPEAAPISYLDQISAKPANKFDFIRKKPILIGLIALVVIILIAIIASLPQSVNPTTQLAARLMATKTVATDVSDNLKNSQLRSINGNLKMYLTNTIRDIKPFLAKNNIDINKLSASATALESTTALMARMEDARLNGVYDRTYAREMAYKLSTIITLYKQIYNSTGDTALKLFLTASQKNIAPIQAQFADFNAANS